MQMLIKILAMIDYTKISDNEEIIRLLKERDKIDEQILELDSMVLVRHALEVLDKIDFNKDKK
jgi:hypothetical protein